MPTEPCVRGTILLGFKTATLELWGPAGLALAVARMPEDTRRACIDQPVVSSAMLPERYTMDWYQAAWDGPAGGKDGPFLAWIDRMMDLGFGRVRKVLLALANPAMVVSKSAELWRHDHDSGDLVVTESGKRQIRMELRNHVYASTPLSRKAIAEVYRYAVGLSCGNKVTQQHAPLPGQSMEVILTLL